MRLRDLITDLAIGSVAAVLVPPTIFWIAVGAAALRAVPRTFGQGPRRRDEYVN